MPRRDDSITTSVGSDAEVASRFDFRKERQKRKYVQRGRSSGREDRPSGRGGSDGSHGSGTQHRGSRNSHNTMAPIGVHNTSINAADEETFGETSDDTLRMPYSNVANLRTSGENGTGKITSLEPPIVHRERLQVSGFLAIVFSLIGSFAVDFVRVEMVIGGLTIETIDLSLEDRVGDKGSAAFGTGTESDEVPILKQIAAYFGCVAIPLMAGVSLAVMSRVDEFGGQKEIAQGWGVACGAYAGAVVVCLLLLLSYDGQHADEPQTPEKPLTGEEEDSAVLNNWSRWTSMPLEGWIFVFLSAVCLLVGGLFLSLVHWREVQKYQDFILNRERNRKQEKEMKDREEREQKTALNTQSADGDVEVTTDQQSVATDPQAVALACSTTTGHGKVKNPKGPVGDPKTSSISSGSPQNIAAPSQVRPELIGAPT